MTAGAPSTPVRLATQRLAVLLLLAANLMFFVGLFGAVVILKSNEPAVFHAMSPKMSRPLDVVMTLFILGGAAVFYVATDRRACLGVAICLAISLAAWCDQVSQLSQTAERNNCLACYYTLSGTCMAEVAIALMMTTIIVWRHSSARVELLRPVLMFLGVIALLIFITFDLQ